MESDENTRLSFFIFDDKAAEINITYCKRILTRFNEMFHASNLCDVILVAGMNKTRITAHRVILSAASKYFAAMFTNNLREKNQAEIVLEEIHGDELKILMNFCYTGLIDINEINVYAILEAASRLEFDDIENECYNFLSNELNVTTCLTTWTTVQCFINFKKLSESAFRCAEENFLEVIESNEFLLLSSNHLFCLLQSEDLDVWSEEDVFNAFVKWVNYSKDTRKFEVKRLLSAIRLTRLRPQFLCHVVKDFCESCDCSDIILNVVLSRFSGQTASSPLKPRKATTMKWLMAIGNHFSTDPEERCSEICSPVTNKWRIYNKLKCEQIGFSSVILNEELYILGGQSKSVQKYDFQTGELIQLASMEVKRTHFGTAILDNDIYAAGGNGLNSVERFDVRTNTWHKVPAMYYRRHWFKLISLSGRLFALGGSDGCNVHNSVECYDPLLNKWTYKSRMNRMRSSFLAFVHKTFIYVLQGFGQHGVEASIEYYNPSIDKWIMIDAEMEELYGMDMIETDSKGICIIAGGKDTKKNHSSVIKINFDTFGTDTLPPMKFGRSYFSLIEMPTYNPNAILLN